jgi:fatty acid-binding protein DegV
MSLLESLLEIVSLEAIAAMYADIAAAIEDGDEDEQVARALLEVLDDFSAGLGADDTAHLIAIGRE